MNLGKDILSVLVAMATPMAVGWLVLNSIVRSRKVFTLFEECSVIFGLGAGLITLGMFYGSIFNILFVYFRNFIWCVFLVAILFWARSQQNSSDHPVPDRPKARFAPFEISLLIFLLFIFAEVLIRTYFGSVSAWDRWAVWAFKAKVYFVHQRVPFERFAEFAQVWGNWDYPQHVPLLEAWIAVHLGYWNEQLTRTIFPVFFIGIVVTMYYFCRPYHSRSISLMAACAGASLPILQLTTVSALAEPVLLFYYCLSLSLLLRWIKTEDQGLFILSAVFSGLMAWTKYEGMVYALFNWIVLFVFLRDDNGKGAGLKVKLLIFYAMLILMVIIPHLAFESAFSIKNIHLNAGNISLGSMLNNLKAVPDCFVALIHYFFSLEKFNIVWPVFLIFWLKNLRQKVKSGPAAFLLLSILFHLLLIVLIRLTNPTDLYLSDAMGRLLIAPAILAVLYIFLSENKSSCL